MWHWSSWFIMVLNLHRLWHYLGLIIWMLFISFWDSWMKLVPIIDGHFSFLLLGVSHWMPKLSRVSSHHTYSSLFHGTLIIIPCVVTEVIITACSNKFLWWHLHIITKLFRELSINLFYLVLKIIIIILNISLLQIIFYGISTKHIR